MEYIKLIQNIDKTPNKPYYLDHYFCDYIEFITLINNGDTISISDIYDRFRIDDRFNDDEYVAEGNDRWNSRIQEWFAILKVRKLTFDEFYPFVITNKNYISLKDDLSNHHKLYLFLLISSNLKYIKNNANILTSDFEELSLKVLKKYLPDNAHSEIFSKKDGILEDKIKTLADNLKYKIKYQENSFYENNTGDGGLDLVAWIPFIKDKNQNNMQVILAQCATGKNWLDKQSDTDKFTSNFIDFKTSVNKAIFIPYDARENNRDFAEQNEILNASLLFDRVRIVYLLTNSVDEISKLSSFNAVVDGIIQYKEPIV